MSTHQVSTKVVGSIEARNGLAVNPAVEEPPERDHLQRPAVTEIRRRAAVNIRRHFARALLRVAALLATDLMTFLVLREAIRAVRAWGWLGAGVRGSVNAVFSEGYLGGWQFAVALLIGLAVTGNYGPGDRRRDPGRIFLACSLATALPLWASLWSVPLLVTLGRYALTVVVLGFSLTLTRCVLDWLVRQYAPNPTAAARTILVGPAGDCIDANGRKALTDKTGFNVLGFVDTHAPPARGALGHLNDLERLLHDHQVDTVLLCGHASEMVFARVVKAAIASECQLLTAARSFELAGVQPSVVWRRGQPFIELRALALRGQQLILKRLMDVTLSATALALFSPILLLLAVMVRLDSAGPIFFRHPRLGRHGRVFNCFKFRSMYVDAEERLRGDPALYQEYAENDYKLPEALDTRITRVGRLLRRTSLDELPQLWNVLKGDMSLVGPRPIVPEEIRHYDEEGPLLLSLKPGITGAWQVNGRSNVAYPERAVLELEYVQDWSLGNDIFILLRTIPVVLGQRGAR